MGGAGLIGARPEPARPSVPDSACLAWPFSPADRSTRDGTTVPAGSYTIFAVPNADKWQLVISKKTGEWGTAYPGPSNDLARIDMKVSKLSSPLENFTISFDHATSGCTLSMSWENTKASVDVSPK